MFQCFKDIQLVELENEATSSDSDCSEETDSDFDLGEVTETNMMLKKPDKIKKPLIEDITWSIMAVSTICHVKDEYLQIETLSVTQQITY